MEMYKIHAIALLIVFCFFGCTNSGLTKKEIERVKSKGDSEIMPLTTILSKGDSLFLRQVARKVDNRNINSSLIHSLKSRMLATVNDSINRGVGIAAPQVGVGIKMIVVKRFDKVNEPFEVCYNPKIIEYSDSINAGKEGCLSVPGYRGQVERSQNIVIAYNDSVGEKQREEISGFTAVIFQHEIDHLNGILYFDHVFGGFNALSPVAE